jgi:hypothetical protein
MVALDPFASIGYSLAIVSLVSGLEMVLYKTKDIKKRDKF